jgi:hypothetical protein
MLPLIHPSSYAPRHIIRISTSTSTTNITHTAVTQRQPRSKLAQQERAHVGRHFKGRDWIKRAAVLLPPCKGFRNTVLLLRERSTGKHRCKVAGIVQVAAVTVVLVEGAGVA